jgi:hypothetical protein
MGKCLFGLGGFDFSTVSWFTLGRTYSETEFCNFFENPFLGVEILMGLLIAEWSNCLPKAYAGPILL